MGFPIREEPGQFVTVEDRLYLTTSRDRVVAEGDPEAAFLLAPAGGRIFRTEAVRLGLLSEGAKESAPAEDKEAAIEETKEIWPAETKRTSRRGRK